MNNDNIFAQATDNIFKCEPKNCTLCMFSETKKKNLKQTQSYIFTVRFDSKRFSFSDNGSLKLLSTNS